MSPFAYQPFLTEPGRPRKSPFDPGGRGEWFVYLSNRNHCTFLFPPTYLDSTFMDLLYEQFPTGYSTLFVLEKWVLLSPGGPPPDLSRLPHFEEEGGKKSFFAVFRDPAATFVGGGAVLSRHDSFEKAIREGREQADRQGVPVVVARIVDTITWH